MIQMLQERRTAIWNDSKALLDNAERQKRNLTPAEETRYQSNNADLDACRDQITKYTDKSNENRSIDKTLSDLAGQPDTRNATSTFGNRGENRWLPTLSEYRGWKADQESRAVNTAGAFIPVEYAGRFFDVLRKRIAIMNADPIVIDIEDAASIKVPSVTADATVGQYAEAALITESDPTLASITITPQKIAAFTLIDREAVESSNPKLLSVVENALMKAFAVQLDSQLINGNGTTPNLLGLLNQSGTTAGPSQGTNGASLTFGALADTLTAYENANNDTESAVWIMNTRTWGSARKLVASGSGQPIISLNPTDGVTPMLWGHKVLFSNNIPITQVQGSANNASSIILADFSQVVIGVARHVELQMSLDYAFQNDQVALRVTGRYGLGLPQPSAVTITTGILP